MNRRSADPQTQALRLVRLYPREWRDRYGDEFGELLAAQISDQPRCSARTVDVIFGAMMARLAAAGLSGTTVDPSDQPRRSLATLGCALALCMTFALSMWSHLTIAQRWAAPETATPHRAIVIMTVGVTVCLAAAIVACVPLGGQAIRTAVRAPEPGRRRGLLVAVTGVAVLIVGAVAFHSGWSSAGNGPIVQQSAGPGGLAAFFWTSTLAVSAYWAHPTILLSLPASELAWMIISPIALVTSVVGAAKSIQRLEVSVRLLRFVTFAGQVAAVGLGLFVVGTLIWLVDSNPGPAHLFQAGTVDKVGLVLMAAGSIVAVRSIQRTTAMTPAR